jgi:hypothetical protein
MTAKERELTKALRRLIKSLPRSVVKHPKVVAATLHAVSVMEKNVDGGQ